MHTLQYDLSSIVSVDVDEIYLESDQEGPMHRKPRTKVRYCKRCGHRLAFWNPGKECYCHPPKDPPKTYNYVPSYLRQKRPANPIEGVKGYEIAKIRADELGYPDLEQALIALYGTLRSIYRVGEALSLSASSVKYHLHRLGVTLEKPGINRRFER